MRSGYTQSTTGRLELACLMIVYASGRRYGKTQALLAWLATEPFAYVVVANQMRKQELLARIRETPMARLGLDHWKQRIIVAGPSLRRERLLGRVAIEDLDEVLRAMWEPIAVEFVTMTAAALRADDWTTHVEDYVDGEEVTPWVDVPEIEGSSHAGHFKET